MGYGSSRPSYIAIAKLTWLINENHNVFVSFNTQPTTGSTVQRRYASPAPIDAYDQQHQRHPELHRQVHRQAPPPRGEGRLVQPPSRGRRHVVGGVERSTPPSSAGCRCSRCQLRADFTCPVTGSCRPQNYRTGGAGYVEDPNNNRYSGSATLTGLFALVGQHQLKGGVQIDYSTYDDTYYTGGGIFARSARPGSRAAPSTADQLPPDDPRVRRLVPNR